MHVCITSAGLPSPPPPSLSNPPRILLLRRRRCRRRSCVVCTRVHAQGWKRLAWHPRLSDAITNEIVVLRSTNELWVYAKKNPLGSLRVYLKRETESSTCDGDALKSLSAESVRRRDSDLIHSLDEVERTQIKMQKVLYYLLNVFEKRRRRNDQRVRCAFTSNCSIWQISRQFLKQFRDNCVRIFFLRRIIRRKRAQR